MVKVSTTGLMLDTLVDNPNIQAALIVDERGYIIEKRGNSPVIKDVDVTEGSRKTALSNIYVVKTGDDFLITIFDERLNFERLKQSVDETLAQFSINV